MTFATSDFGDHAWAQSAAFRQLLEDERKDADRVVYCCAVCRFNGGAFVPLVEARCAVCNVEYALPEAR